MIGLGWAILYNSIIEKYVDNKYVDNKYIDNNNEIKKTNIIIVDQKINSTDHPVIKAI